MEFKEFMSRYLGIIIGILVACVIIAFRWMYLVECLVLIGIGAWVGNYVQANKTLVKNKLKKGIDRILKDDEE